MVNQMQYLLLEYRDYHEGETDAMVLVQSHSTREAFDAALTDRQRRLVAVLDAMEPDKGTWSHTSRIAGLGWRNYYTHDNSCIYYDMPHLRRVDNMWLWHKDHATENDHANAQSADV